MRERIRNVTDKAQGARAQDDRAQGREARATVLRARAGARRNIDIPHVPKRSKRLEKLLVPTAQNLFSPA